MKVFKVWADSYDYDEFDGAVVVAESEEDIRSRLFHNDVLGKTLFMLDGLPEFERFSFYDCQGEIHIEEVPTDKVAVILTSYNAG